MNGLHPLGAAPLGGWWQPTQPVVPVFTPADLVAGDVVWLVEIGVSRPPDPTSATPPVGMLGGWAWGDPARPADLPQATPEIYVADRGWLGEPSDGTAPHRFYAPRLADPPALEMQVAVLPEAPRRLAFMAGEIRLANADGVYDTLAANWSVGGRPVRILRGPHKRPRHADFATMVPVAHLRAAGPASGTIRLAIPLVDMGADLSVPVCQTYGGTGGADGVASLEGQPKPRLYGIRRQIEPVLEDSTRLIYRLHHGGPLEAVLAVRDRGVPLSANGDVATYAALQAAAPAAGTYTSCLAEGVIRVGATPSVLTVDAKGDALGGYSAGTSASIARKLITGPGGVSAAMIEATAFSDWPVGEAGIYLQGGTVEQALDQVAAGIAGWWGVTRLGFFDGGRIAAPEGQAPAFDLQPWMLRQPPEALTGDPPPRWRVTVGYQALGRVLQGEDLAGSVSAANRELWGKPWQTAVSADGGIQSTYPLAQDAPLLESTLDSQSDAEALALYLRELHGTPRRSWRVPLNRAGLAMRCGQAVRLTWPRHGLAAGRTLLVRAISVRGDTTEAVLWG